MKKAEQAYFDLLPGNARRIASLNVTKMIAPGMSASAYVNDLEHVARDLGIELPDIQRLSRRESRAMYYRLESDPISVLEGIMAITEYETTIHFIDDYTAVGNKARTLDVFLLRSASQIKNQNRPRYNFFHHILVSEEPVSKSNVEIYSVDKTVAKWRDRKFNAERSGQIDLKQLFAR